MKRYIPLFLLVILSINHLNIIDSVMHFSMALNQQEQKQDEQMPDPEESEQDAKDKEKAGENEKYLTIQHGWLSGQTTGIHIISNFIGHNTRLNRHPYTESDKQPPKNQS